MRWLALLRLFQLPPQNNILISQFLASADWRYNSRLTALLVSDEHFRWRHSASLNWTVHLSMLKQESKVVLLQELKNILLQMMMWFCPCLPSWQLSSFFPPTWKFELPNTQKKVNV